MPKVTVLMPVYNGEIYVREAIDSVLQQSFQDFELLIMDDGSTDGTLPIIRHYQDSRIRLEKRKHDFIDNLNEGIRLAQGKYIARMDADDRMHSERLRVQVKLMEQAPEIAVCGSWMKNFGNGIFPQVIRSFNGEIGTPLLQMLKGNILFHPTIMLRKSFLTRHHLQYEEYPYAEDYKLYSEIAKLGGIFYVEPQVLLFYRNSSQQVSQTKQKEMNASSRKIREEIVDFLLDKYQEKNGEVGKMYDSLLCIEKRGFLSAASLFSTIYEVFQNYHTR